MPAFMAAADALLVHLRPSHIADHAVPTKILSYFAAGRPVVCATGGAAEAVVAAAEAGLTSAPGDAGALAASVALLAASAPEYRDRLGRNGRAYLREHFNRDRIIDQYEQVLAAVAAPGASAGSRAEGHA